MADFIDVEYEVVDGHDASMNGEASTTSQLDGPFTDLTAELFDRLVQGNKGRVMTEALIAAGIAGPSLRTAYNENPAAIEHFANQLDSRRLAELLAPGIDTAPENALPLMASFGAGAAAFALARNLFQD